MNWIDGGHQFLANFLGIDADLLPGFEKSHHLGLMAQGE
jgi:hypothetical protein